MIEGGLTLGIHVGAANEGHCISARASYGIGVVWRDWWAGTRDSETRTIVDVGLVLLLKQAENPT